MMLNSLQESLLAMLTYSEEHAQRIRNIVEIQHYSGHYRLIAVRIYDFIDRFKKPPGDHLPDLLNDKLEGKKEGETELYRDIITAIHSSYPRLNQEYINNQIEVFIKRQSMRALAIDLSKALQRDTEESLDEADSILSRAGKQYLSVFDPGTRLSNKDRALEFLNGGVTAFPTGIPELDKRGFGPTRQELFLYIANVKTGKSWFLVHLAKICLLNRLRIVHITLEMSESRVSQRYFQTFFALAKRKDKLRTTRLTLDASGHLDGFSDQIMLPRLALEDPNIEAQLIQKMERWGSRVLDNVYIKQFPTRSLTISQLKGYLDNLESTEQFIPDILIIDYPDLFKIPITDFRLGLSQVYQDLRGIAVERNLSCVVVSQTNREGGNAKRVGLEHTAEHYGKAQDADVIVTYSQTDAEHNLGLARLHVAGGRNDQDGITIVITQQYGTGQFVIDSALMNKDYFNKLEETT